MRRKSGRFDRGVTIEAIVPVLTIFSILRDGRPITLLDDPQAKVGEGTRYG
jgi:hypothetical protein